MKKIFTINNYISEKKKVLEHINSDQFIKAINLIEEFFEQGRQVFIFGNGGSATTASHCSTDWVKMSNLSTGKKYKCYCLNDNVGLVTAYANDISYNEIFSGQLKALMEPNDLVIAISGSGNSKNTIHAMKTASEIGGTTLGIVGFDGGKLKDSCDHIVHIPSFDMQICEDIHLMFCQMVMKHLSKSPVVINNSL